MPEARSWAAGARSKARGWGRAAAGRELWGRGLAAVVGRPDRGLRVCRVREQGRARRVVGQIDLERLIYFLVFSWHGSVRAQQSHFFFLIFLTS